MFLNDESLTTDFLVTLLYYKLVNTQAPVLSDREMYQLVVMKISLQQFNVES